MEMKQYKINQAYNTINILKDSRFPVSYARSIYMMLKQLEPHFQFCVEEERKRIEEFNGRIESDGKIYFKDKENAAKFNAAREEIENAEVELDIEPIHMDINLLQNVSLSPADIGNLDGFIEIE